MAITKRIRSVETAGAKKELQIYYNNLLPAAMKMAEKMGYSAKWVKPYFDDLFEEITEDVREKETPELMKSFKNQIKDALTDKKMMTDAYRQDAPEPRGPNAGGGGPRKPSTPKATRQVTKITEGTKKALANAIIAEIKNLRSYNNYARLAKGARKLAELWEKRASLDPKAEAQKKWQPVWSEFLASVKKGRLDDYVDDKGVLNCTDTEELSNYVTEMIGDMDEFDGDFLQEAHDFLRDFG